MTVSELMTTPVCTCRNEDTLRVAAERMWDGDIGVVPVVNDEGRLTGILTDRDICMAAYLRGQTLEECRVDAVMRTDVAACHPDNSLEDVQEIMRTLQVRRLPVVDDEGRPVGMVSLNDLALAATRAENGRMGLHREGVLATFAAVSLHRRPQACDAAAGHENGAIPTAS